MDSKAIWREYARQHFHEGQIQSSAYVAALVGFLTDLAAGGAIVTYSAINSEVDLSSLVDKMPEGRLCLTRTPEEGRELTVHRLSGQPMERHRFGFTQPTLAAAAVADSEISVVLVPGLVFDQYGGRLGHGMGYYDRFLGRLRDDVVRVGITRDIVLSDALPVESHDVAMTHLASSEGVEPVLVLAD